MSEWWVLRAGESGEYIAVFSDERPSPDSLTLEIDCGGSVDVLTNFTVVYGPCSQDDARDYLDDMRINDGIVCFLCNGLIDLRKCEWRAVEDEESKVEYPICPHCGYKQVNDG